MIAYRFDRRNEIFVGQTITLTPFLVDELNEYNRFIRGEFPEGVTSHGMSYFINTMNVDYLKPNTIDNFISATIEAVFELRRQLHFPDMPSRYQSIFAVESLEDAKKWKSILEGKIEYPLYELEFESQSHKLDASWLSMGSPIAFSICNFLADKYWSGESSDNPIYELLIRTPAKVVRKLPDDWHR